MYQIIRDGNGHIEVVDEFTTKREAQLMLVEYRISDWSASYYIKESR
jgi:hypothetical protein